MILVRFFCKKKLRIDSEDEEERMFPENSPTIVLHVSVKGWVEDIYVPEIASVVQLKVVLTFFSINSQEIISKQASAKLFKIEEKLALNRHNLDHLLDELVEHLSQVLRIFLEFSHFSETS
jgi:hypothetical protein